MGEEAWESVRIAAVRKTADEWALVLEAVGGFIELLERHLRVVVEFLVVDELSDRTLAAVDLLQDLLQVRHGRRGFVVQGGVFDQPAHRNLGQVYLRQGEWSTARGHLVLSQHILEEMDTGGWLLAEVYRHGPYQHFI